MQEITHTPSHPLLPLPLKEQRMETANQQPHQISLSSRGSLRKTYTRRWLPLYDGLTDGLHTIPPSRYLRQFLQGCGTPLCQTPLCASNTAFPFKDANEIAAKAVEAATNGTRDLCPRLEARASQNGVQREIVAGKICSIGVVLRWNSLNNV